MKRAAELCFQAALILAAVGLSLYLADRKETQRELEVMAK